jgi:hypothetical protein
MHKVSGKVSQCNFIWKTDILVYQNNLLFAIHLVQHSSCFSRLIYVTLLRKNARFLLVYFVKSAKLGANFVT